MSARIKRSRGYRLIEGVTAFDILIENRILIFCDPLPCGELTEKLGLASFTSLALEANLNILASESADPIKIWILATEGATLQGGWELYNSIICWKEKMPIYTIGDNCFNVGMIILAMGTPGHRYIHKGSRLELALTPLSRELLGKMSKEDRELMEHLHFRIIDIFASYCNFPEKRKEELRKIIIEEGEWKKVFTPEEALEWGFVDKLMTPEEFRKLFCTLRVPTKIYLPKKCKKCKKGEDNDDN